MIQTKLQAWKVICGDVWIDTVFYKSDCDAKYVLMCESKYDSNIRVERVK